MPLSRNGRSVRSDDSWILGRFDDEYLLADSSTNIPFFHWGDTSAAQTRTADRARFSAGTSLDRRYTSYSSYDSPTPHSSSASAWTTTATRLPSPSRMYYSARYPTPPRSSSGGSSSRTERASATTRTSAASSSSPYSAYAPSVAGGAAPRSYTASLADNTNTSYSSSSSLSLGGGVPPSAAGYSRDRELPWWPAPTSSAGAGPSRRVYASSSSRDGDGGGGGGGGGGALTLDSLSRVSRHFSDLALARDEEERAGRPIRGYGGSSGGGGGFYDELKRSLEALRLARRGF
ncbi:hypothetical protein MFIFM68171_00902 [Madurella fahalii]|uniref:Uncharacterized protein n=1 Tax=Madurella fahalii TaxID=1157608 RepID=A0ABQ0FYW1_9PEZI